MTLSALKRKKEALEQEGYVLNAWIETYRPAGTAKGDGVYCKLRTRTPFENGKCSRHLKAGEIPVFRRLVDNGRALRKLEREIANLQRRKPSARAVLTSSASDEWYTPPEYVELARAVLGGIDIDPASSETAQGWIQAAAWYTLREDGLMQPWAGRLWLNPPYGGQIGQWTRKAIEEYRNGTVRAAVLLVRPAPGSAWYQELSGLFACCTPHKRIRFIDAGGTPQASPVHGNAFFYLGEDVERFREVFDGIGVVARPFLII